VVLRFKQNLGSSFERLLFSEIAISNRNGTIAFHMSGGGCAGGGLGQIRLHSCPKNHLLEHPEVTFGKTMMVKTRALDDWRAEYALTNIDFLSMDVQGAESDVIVGATETLNRTRFLYTEYSNNESYEGRLPLRQLLALPCCGAMFCSGIAPSSGVD
jgi:2-O-methyltransferase